MYLKEKEKKKIIMMRYSFIEEKAKILQYYFRRFNNRKMIRESCKTILILGRYKKLNVFATRIQRAFKRVLMVHEMERRCFKRIGQKIMNAALKIQAVWRGHKGRAYAQSVLNEVKVDRVVMIQKNVRRFLAQRKYQKTI
mmetsp:Transcript_85003/g.183259  ORF Transcript_85003/g.183259 Transcript_85003/m.183259 type:complete len:140 (+) Transcript_85003:263-682(+)